MSSISCGCSEDFRDIAIIQEIYDGESSYEVFENDLETALESGISTIVIEPTRLGEETARWIALGNCLHKTAVLSGLGTVLTASLWPDRWYLYSPLAFTSLLCSTIYGVSWQFDPCCKYQVETNLKNLAKLPLHTLVSNTPIVLVRKDDTYRKILHSAFTLGALAHCGYLFYRLCST
ncbi:TMEM11 [Cordylochernes scorpioides]|uniref:TMEM11 n=1 Tax=Cordylochernes scorpioides TaxID=51811 RepID=A0ABY6L5I4_9ARAC|nr:TMEM11 [Cordylochernes scorpioides]